MGEKNNGVRRFYKNHQAAFLQLIDKIQELNKGWLPHWEDEEETREYFAYMRGGYGLGIEKNINGETQVVPDYLLMRSGVANKVWKVLGEKQIIFAMWGKV